MNENWGTMHAASALDKRTHFRYNARAAALQGHLSLPISAEIEPQAAVDLPLEGGFATERVEDYKLQHFVSFDAAHTSVTGAYDPEDDAFFTVVTACVEGLNILGVISADRIVARLMSKTAYVDPSKPAPEPSFVPTGSHFDNLVIAGHPVTIKLNVGAMCDLDTYGKASKDGAKRLGKAFVKNHQIHGGTVECSLVESIDTGGAPELQLRGHDSIFIEQFGTIRFAEFVVNKYERHITMLRVALGCGHKGLLLAAVGQGNGTGGTMGP
jgi:hypothetical protein